MKQAVVLIHGIGEQVPMDTLRGFVEASWISDSTLRSPNVTSQVWSKPDTISGDYELRRLTTAEDRNGRRTDFFEFYWAHLMQGTKLSQVGAWIKVLILRRPSRMPRQLRGAWWLIVIMILLGVITYLNSVFEWLPMPHWIGKIGALSWFLLSSSVLGLVINVAGDAARYLHVAPPNIEVRRRIREAGIQLLEKLHASSKYDRIIVVGHSLGSVIGYDILTHLWPRYHETAAQANPSSPAYPAMEALEVLARAEKLDVDQYQSAQSDYLVELQSQGNKWLVTDFVTMGSPLAHATFLMARNDDEFERKKKEREFPICPPFLEEISLAGTPQRKFTFLSNKIWIPHHSAVFAPTRWTNLYFPCSHTIWGDLIGGAVAPTFGDGVRDISVETDLRWGLFSHTLYWSSPRCSTKQAAPSWILEARRALRICC